MPSKPIKITAENELTPEKRELLAAQEQVQAAGLTLREQKAKTIYWMEEANRRAKELDVALAIKQPQREIRITPKLSSHTSESTALVVLSDWHVEETVDPGTVNGKNAFNLEIADRRITTLFQKVLLLTKIWRTHTRVDNLILAMLGDFISGYIHEELQEGNELSPTEAIRWVQQRLVGGIQMLLREGEFKSIVIPCCIGNHGRTTKKPRIATAYRNNYEWLMYHNMALLFEMMGEKRVRFQIENSYHNYLEVYGRTLRFHHGDFFNYQEGVGGITIPVNKGIMRWNKTRDAWLDIFGHWHQGKDDGAWICNGSLIGYNPYAVRIKATFELPSQMMIFIEKDHGKTATLPIWLDTDRIHSSSIRVPA